MTEQDNNNGIDLSSYLIKSRKQDGDHDDIILPFCLYNASGPRCGTYEALQKVQDSVAGGIVTKSATLASQNGNVHPRTYHTPNEQSSFNSEGLPNQGIDYFINPEMIQQLYQQVEKKKRKPYIVSLSGKTIDDNIEMLRRISVVVNSQQNNDSNSKLIDSIELNMACPNIIGKPIIGYDYEQIEMILQRISECEFCNTLPALGIKLPPYFDFQHYTKVCTILNQYQHIIRYVVSTNTVGNCLAIDYENNMPYIASNDGYAGLSGPCIKYIALANVRKLRELLHESISVIGVGGIRNGQDVYEMLLCGANACQIATTFWKEGPIAFQRIQNELYMIMKEKGYTSLQHDVIHQLKPYQKIPRNHSITTTTKTSLSNKLDHHHEQQQPQNEILFYKRISMILIIIIAILLHPYYV